MTDYKNSRQKKGNDMSNNEKYMFSALMLSTVLMMINIVAVTSGMADSFYSELTEWLNNL